MAFADIQQGAVGAALRLPITTVDEAGNVSPLSLAESPSPVVRLENPSHVSRDLQATIQGDPADGIVLYVTQPGDLDEIGSYRIQAFIQIGGGTFPTEVTSFLVQANIAAPNLTP